MRGRHERRDRSAGDPARGRGGWRRQGRRADFLREARSLAADRHTSAADPHADPERPPPPPRPPRTPEEQLIMAADQDKIKPSRPTFELDGREKEELSQGLLHLQIIETT